MEAARAERDGAIWEGPSPGARGAGTGHAQMALDPSEYICEESELAPNHVHSQTIEYETDLKLLRHLRQQRAGWDERAERAKNQ